MKVDHRNKLLNKDILFENCEITLVMCSNKTKIVKNWLSLLLLSQISETDNNQKFVLNTALKHCSRLRRIKGCVEIVSKLLFCIYLKPLRTSPSLSNCIFL